MIAAGYVCLNVLDYTYSCIILCSSSMIDAVETKEGYSAVKEQLRKKLCINFQVNTQN